MKRVVLLFLSLFSLGTSCHKDGVPSQVGLGVTVTALATLDCKIPLLDIGTKSDVMTAVAQLTGVRSRYYYGIQLDKQFMAGDSLSVTIRKCTQDEIPACTTRGTGYSAVTVLTAVK